MLETEKAPAAANSEGPQTKSNTQLIAQLNDDANSFLEALDQMTALCGLPFTFQTFDDVRVGGKPRKLDRLANVLHGAFNDVAPHLQTLNDYGAGVFVTVNETDGLGRTADKITRLRAVYCDFDDLSKTPSFPLPPSISVETSPGKSQHYWLLVEPIDVKANPEGVKRYQALQRGLLAFGHDPACGTDIARVLRLPGFLHMKGEPHLVRLLEATGTRYSLEALEAAYPYVSEEKAALAPLKPTKVYPIAPPDVVAALLAPIPAEERDVWNKVGMALCRTYAGHEHETAVCQAFDAWAATASNHTPGETDKKWQAKDWGKAGRIGFGTIVNLHREHGGTVAWPPKAPPEAGAVTTISAGDVQIRNVEWLWLNRIPFGKFVLLGGHPGTGKSQIALDIAARVSTGAAFPDGWEPLLGNVILLSAEDDTSDTVVPRLKAAGADLRRVRLMQGVATEDGKGERQFSLTQDVAGLEAEIERLGGCSLIVIDVVDAYLGGTDSHKNAAVRGVLAPLARLAEKHRCTVLGITHFNKSEGGAAITKFNGSIAFVGAARAGFVTTRERNEDGEETGQMLFLPAKSNLGPPAHGYVYRIETQLVDAPYAGQAISTSRIVWGEQTSMTADAAIAPPPNKRKSKQNDAAHFLRELLKHGPLAADEVKEAAKAEGISEATLRRAKQSLDIKVAKAGMDGFWQWSLPEKGALH